MADNLAVTPGTGTIILADEVTHATFGTGIVGITKLMDGAVGGTALIGGDATNGLDVDVTRVSGTVTISGTVTANAGTNLNTSALALEAGGNLAAAATSLAVMDDWDETDRAKVNIIVGQAGVQGGSGAVSATTQRVVLATDVALPAGTNAIGIVDTELPAAAALADNASNPTAPAVGAFGMAWDGATWDRVPGTSVDGVLVNLGSNNDVSVTGTVSVSGSVTANAGTNLNTSALALESGNVATILSSIQIMDDWDETDRAKVNLIVGQAGVAGGSGTVGATTQRVCVATDTTVAVTQSGTWTVTSDSEFPAAASLTDNFANPTTTNVAAMNMVWDGATWDRAPGTSTDGLLVNLGANNDVTVTGSVNLVGATSGGDTLHSAVSAASTNATSVKGSAGQLYWVAVYNTNASPRYFKVYNKATSPTVGTDTPVLRFTIPGNTGGGGLNIAFPNGAAFATGIAYALTTGAADADTGAVAASEILVNLGYK